MDIESDESDRWEDFFGSSTDLTPSLIGLYDKLTDSLNEALKATENLNILNGNETTANNIEFTFTHENNFKKNIEKVLTANCIQNKHRNFHILSPNVQRLISNSNTSVESVDHGIAKPNFSIRSGGKGTRRIISKQKLSHIPLSKNTCKLTQAGNELVDTIDLTSTSSTESLEANREALVKTPVPYQDNDKTPTNSTNGNFCFESMTKLNNNESLYNKLHSNHNDNSPHINPKNIQDTKTFKDILEKIHHAKSIKEKDENFTLKNHHIKNIISNTQNVKDFQEQFSDVNQITEARNYLIKVPQNLKSNEHNSLAQFLKQAPTSKATSPSSPLLTYSRAKILANKSIVHSHHKLSVESLDRLTDMKKKIIFSPNISPGSNRKTALILPDIARLQHRPLSSSSICSTSSSSSSGSEIHLNGKLGTSYLASVESLADPSENESIACNSNLTVLERSCMEMVDSERIYVEDLGQVIKGYLQDWKERACLKVDELKVLFSNIEEIYDFNSVLLMQLVNSDMDPGKIAKCFISLRDRFDVYTTYCTSYPDAISLLTTLLQASHTNALLTSTQKMLQHTLPLGSYLLKPVQRILKYHLLLDNLRKHCSIEEVVQAYGIMREVARNIDQVKRKLEQQSRVKELSGILDGWLGPELTVLGELRLEGLLMENSKPRMVFLFQTMLIITKPKEDSRLQFKSYIYRNNLMLREHLPGEPTSFNVIPYDEPRNQIKLAAKNRDQKRLWAQNIKGVILEQFDIPNRAKELVYKLGDEEDRTPDKNTWKWGLNTATPIYLERRNQYRRSEMRNKSKLKRKTITNSTSLEGFSNRRQGNLREFVRNQSVDDNLMVSLPNVSKEVIDIIHTRKSKENLNKEKSQKDIDTKLLRIKMKERSKSVPRMSSSNDPESDDDFTVPSDSISKNFMGSCYLSKISTLTRGFSCKEPDVKLYTTKTVPKRIANLRKHRSKKETFRFYMDINEMDTTVLRITESIDNLTENKKTGEDENQTINEENFSEKSTENCSNSEDVKGHKQRRSRRDVEIISDLIKSQKDFDKILKKPPRKRSLESCMQKLNSEPPRPPSNSPPQSDSEEHSIKNLNNTLDNQEHIYESLLRNVHVPYKFSPVLNRSKSQQYYSTQVRDELKPRVTPRPESDYVTLIYSPSGELEKVRGPGEVLNNTELLSTSDSKINYQHSATSSLAPPTSTDTDSQTSVPNQEVIVQFKQSQPLPYYSLFKCDKVSTSESSLVIRGRKNSENFSFRIGKNKPPERWVSDVTEMCRQGIIHRQGSESVGERIAHLDYVDPRCLFNNTYNTSAASLNPQRDSVFSLTSSNDSVCDNKNRNIIGNNKTTPSSNFFYEDNVEANLETDFRDSAVYSDDNERRQDSSYDDKTGNSKNPTNLLPPPLPKRPQRQKVNEILDVMVSKSTTSVISPTVIEKPDLPPKPSAIIQNTAPREHLMPSCSQSMGKSWVLKQIENFNK